MNKCRESKTKISIVSQDRNDGIALKSMLQLVNDFDIVGEVTNNLCDGSLTPFEDNPDVVLISIGTPGDNAIQIASELKTTIASMKVFMVSSIDSEQNLFDSLAAGADGYGTRDTNFETLIEGIRAVAEGLAWIDPTVSKRVLEVDDQLEVESNENLSLAGTERRAISMSFRELELLRLVAQGLSHQEVANHLRLSAELFRTHMRHILEKIALGERIQAASSS